MASANGPVSQYPQVPKSRSPQALPGAASMATRQAVRSPAVPTGPTSNGSSTPETVVYDPDDNGDVAGPSVMDFEDRFLSQEERPAQGLAAGSEQTTRGRQLPTGVVIDSDDEIAAPPPDFSRIGKSRERTAKSRESTRWARTSPPRTNLPPIPRGQAPAHTVRSPPHSQGQELTMDATKSPVAPRDLRNVPLSLNRPKGAHFGLQGSTASGVQGATAATMNALQRDEYGMVHVHAGTQHDEYGRVQQRVPPNSAPQTLRAPASGGMSRASNRSQTNLPRHDSSYNASKDSHFRASEDSVFSEDTYETQPSSVSSLPPLQTKGLDESDQMESVGGDDPLSFDLVTPAGDNVQSVSHILETRSLLLFSHQHLETIFADPSLLLKFTSFMSTHRPQSIPILVYYLDALKALRALAYANSVSKGLESIHGLPFTEALPEETINRTLRDKARQAFDVLVNEELPAYITHVWTQVVSLSIQKRITGTLAPHLREMSEGLAEVFCLTDPSRPDNPIVFASQEFNRTTQYGMSYVIGRNCRFLQGPKTTQHSVKRIGRSVMEQRDHCEVLLNYRRDGSPFMNLLMTAPLYDSRGKVRYYIGAQVDVSGLIKDETDLEGFQRLIRQQMEANNEANASQRNDAEQLNGEKEHHPKDEFQELSEMFNISELDTVRMHGGSMHKEHVEESAETDTMSHHRPRLLLKDDHSPEPQPMGRPVYTQSPTGHVIRQNGRLSGIFQHYLLIRPYPSLRIIFTSPSLRVPGILQAPFMSKIGGSNRVRDELTAALARGDNVTAKIRWVFRSEEEGRARWIHCTPLLGGNGAVGVWMVVLVDEEGSVSQRRFRQAPPVAQRLGQTQGMRPDSRDDYTLGHGRGARMGGEMMQGGMMGPAVMSHTQPSVRQPRSSLDGLSVLGRSDAGGSHSHVQGNVSDQRYSNETGGHSRTGTMLGRSEFSFQII